MNFRFLVTFGGAVIVCYAWTWWWDAIAGAVHDRIQRRRNYNVLGSRSTDGDVHEKGTVVGMGTSAPEKPSTWTNGGTDFKGRSGKPDAARPSLSATSRVSQVVEALDHAAGSEPADSHSDDPWRKDMTHRAALTALTKYPRLADDPRELTTVIWPFEQERARVLMRRRTKGIH